MRTITINAGTYLPDETDADRWEQLENQCNGDARAINLAIGHLSQWSMNTYPFVDINLQGRKGEMELLAVYRKEKDGKPEYVIGAVWHDDHFGFHS